MFCNAFRWNNKIYNKGKKFHSVYIYIGKQCPSVRLKNEIVNSCQFEWSCFYPFPPLCSTGHITFPSWLCGTWLSHHTGEHWDYLRPEPGPQGYTVPLPSGSLPQPSPRSWQNECPWWCPFQGAQGLSDRHRASPWARTQCPSLQGASAGFYGKCICLSVCLYIS